jgi:predicted TIM-barrel fold metal-dependent hydrolase
MLTVIGGSLPHRQDSTMDRIQPTEDTRWRLDSPGKPDWPHEVRPGTNKYFMISVDSHLMPNMREFVGRLDRKWHDQMARVEKRDDGQRYLIVPGMRPERLLHTDFAGDDLARSEAGGDIIALARDGHGDPVGLERILDQARDGVDGEVIFPNGPVLLMWSSNDVEFVAAQCRAWNDWAWEVCGPYKEKCNPAAALATADIDQSVAEVERVAKLGYRVLLLPCKPIWGEHRVEHINYNLPIYDRLWAAIQDHDLAITYHVSTGKDPRAARGNGGAVINYVVHSLAPTIEPIVSMCASGVFERFPNLRAGTIEADAGWVPWMLEKMDESYLKHHFWVRPKLEMLPSDYYRRNCFASFGEDRAAVALCEEFGLEDNLMWANDYPHHEGSWPYSAEAIERTFTPALPEKTRAKLLGLNAARVFKFDVPKGAPGL